MRGLWVLALATAVLCPNSLAAQRAAPPAEATAQCKDGTYSTSTTARGTCSGHGGVASWLATARCEDGTLSMSKTRKGTCSGHGGVVEWLATAVCHEWDALAGEVAPRRVLGARRGIGVVRGAVASHVSHSQPRRSSNEGAHRLFGPYSRRLR